MNRFTAIIFAGVLSGCGGGGGGGESFDKTNLSTPPALKTLFDSMTTANKKGQFESDADYGNRVNNYSTSLTGYRSTLKISATYDANTREIKIRSLPRFIDEGQRDTQTAFYMGFTEMTVENNSDLYQPTTRDEPDSNGTIRRNNYYKIIPADATEAQRIIEGFRVDYTYTFSSEQVKSAGNRCISANFTQCINRLNGNASTFRAYNVVDGKQY